VSDRPQIRLALEVAKEHYAWMRKSGLGMKDFFEATGRFPDRVMKRPKALSVLASEWLKLKRKR
jgi:hypothetical protein